MYTIIVVHLFFFFSSRRRHTRFDCDWSSDVCSSDLLHRAYGIGERLQSHANAERSLRLGLPVEPHVSLARQRDRKSTRLNSSHSQISYAVFCLKKKKNPYTYLPAELRYMPSAEHSLV